MKRISLTKGTRSSILGILVLSICITAYLMGQTFLKKEYVEVESSVLSYNASLSILLTPVFLPEIGGYSYIFNPMGTNFYVLDTINAFKVETKFNFSSDKECNIKGYYSINSLLKGYLNLEKNEYTLWSVGNPMAQKQEFKNTGKSYGNKKNMEISLVEPRNLVAEIKQLLKVNHLTKFKVSWDGELEVLKDNKVQREKIGTMIEIPLGEKFFELRNKTLVWSKKGEIKNKVRTMEQGRGKGERQYIVVLSGLMVALLFMLIFTKRAAVDPMQRRIGKIFKAFGPRLICVKEIPARDYQNRINLCASSDMIKIADELGKPVLYSEKEFKNGDVRFFILDGQDVFELDALRQSYS